MPTFRYAKLVRDKIPGWHREDGHDVVGRRLEGDEKRAALCQKLSEEAVEVMGATTPEERLGEIADLQQIVDDLRDGDGFTVEALRSAVDKKRAHKGGFSNGEYIETVTMRDENDKWARYCRATPDKYPEVDPSE